MRRKIFLLVGAGSLAALAIGWSLRVSIADVWSATQTKRKLPAPQTFTAKVQNNAATSTDPLAWNKALPREMNLAVPFLSQAPKQNWNAPFQEACEEASLAMVDAFYKGRKKAIAPDEGERAIVALTNFSNRMFKGREDTTVEENARVMREFYGYRNILIRDLKSGDELKKALANGYPVIVPASGKALKNPNFRNGGPVYHMLVVKGYTADGRWITNDPGTRRGADYLYSNAVLMNAIHDWNGGEVVKGAKKFMVVLPPASTP